MITKVSRRDFLKGAVAVGGTGLVLGVFSARSRSMPFPETTAPSFEPNVFVSIDNTGQVSIVCARVEMGQGVRASMPMLVAEELEVDFEQIKVVQGDGDKKYGNQNTDGSTSARTQWQPLRKAGAAARMMLIAAAAETWGVKPEACRAESGRVYHNSSGRELGYGALAEAASRQPVPENPVLKDPKSFKLIGTPRKQWDIKEIVTGKAKYGMDYRMPDMAFAGIERCPVKGGKLKTYDASKALAIPGVLKVVPMEPSGPPTHLFSGLLVVGETSWAVIQGRKALEIEWDEGENAGDSTAASKQRLTKELDKAGKVYREEGKPYDMLKKGEVMEASYLAPYLSHAPMEPLVCAAWVKEDSCEVWAATQGPQWARGEISKALQMDHAKVTVHVTLLGGGFGRKDKPDVPVEAALASKAAGMPLKLFWTREDEIRFGFYRPENMQVLKAVLGEDGKPLAWVHRTAFPPIANTFNPATHHPNNGEMSQSCTTLPYRIPHVCMEAGEATSPLRIGWMRSVHHMFHSWSINCFTDELAEKAGKDPIQYQLDLLGEPRILEFSEEDKKSPFKFDTGRLTHVIKLVRDKSGWGRDMPKGEGLGFAAQYSFYSYVAMVAHVTMKDNGDYKVNRVVAAVDCGIAINPDAVRAQIEGGINYGLSAAMFGELTVAKGRVEQGNFDGYRVLRISEAPVIEIHLVKSDKDPTGIGEPGTPPTAGALCNALYAATGKRHYQLPVPQVQV